MTSRFLRPTLSVLLALTGFVGGAAAQAQTAPPTATPGGPGGPGGMQRPRGPRPAPTNIKALAKDISGDDLIKLMREYEGALGVECEFCHAKNPATGRNDFASDANPMKDRARVMIRMTQSINDTYLTQLTDPRTTIPVTCGTCHQGMSKPALFVPKPQQRGPPPPPPPATPPPSH
jgi:hypothetical protein